MCGSHCTGYGSLQGQVLGIGVDAAVKTLLDGEYESSADTGNAGTDRSSRIHLGKRSNVLVHPILCEED